MTLTDKAQRRSQGTWQIIVAVLFVGILAARSAIAAPGDLDPSFGTGGAVTFPISTRYGGAANVVRLQPDGKIVAAGTSFDGSHLRFSLARLNPDGSLDGTFGIGGGVTTKPGYRNNIIAGLALQSDGMIVAVGVSQPSVWHVFALARYSPNGDLDPSFGIAGTVTTEIGMSDAYAWDAILQPDGKVIAIGTGYSGGTESFVLVRYSPDGSLDQAFGDGGIAAGSPEGDAWAAVLQPDGKIVAAGGSAGGTTLARYQPNGLLDATFGGGGIVLTNVGYAYDLALQPDGKIVTGMSRNLLNG